MWVAPPTQITALKYRYRIRIHFSRFTNLCKIFPTPAYSLFAPARTIHFLLYLYYIINFFRCQLLYALGFSHCSCSKPKIVLTSVWSLLVVLKCKLDKFKKL